MYLCIASHLQEQWELALICRLDAVIGLVTLEMKWVFWRKMCSRHKKHNVVILE